MGKANFTQEEQRSLRRIEPLYFLDYCTFSGLLRQYISDNLTRSFSPSSDSGERRFFFMSILSQEYTAYEDAAAMLKALLDYRVGDVDFPLLTLMGYSPGEAHLDSVFTDRQITCGDTLYQKLKLEDWLPSQWAEWFPDLDLKKALQQCCRFLVEDCRRNQKKYGIATYNKIKHGLLIVPSANAYEPTMPDIPAAIVPKAKGDPSKREKPYVLYALKTDDTEIDNRQQSLNYIQRTLRLFAALYLSTTYPDHVQKRWPRGVQEMFMSRSFSDLQHFLGEVKEKY